MTAAEQWSVTGGGMGLVSWVGLPYSMNSEFRIQDPRKSPVTRILTLSDAVAAHARLQPAKLGTRDSRRELTYRQWDERASRLASGLLGRGLMPGDRVALLAYNCVEWMEIYVGLARA